MENEQKNLVEKLLAKNVNDHTEKKDGLTYLSWAWAWTEFLKACPTATYEVKKFTNEKTGEVLPFLYKENLGYMVFTSVSALGVTKEMWLPVMDNTNRAMLDHEYKYKVKKYEINPKTGRKEWLGNYDFKIVEPANMFDINKAIMRCLTKNLAMFGLGSYIYAGEDLPFEEQEPCTAEQVKKMRELNVIEPNVCKAYNVSKIEDLSFIQAEFVITTKEKANAKK